MRINSELTITVERWTFSERLQPLSEQKPKWSVKLSAQW